MYLRRTFFIIFIAILFQILGCNTIQENGGNTTPLDNPPIEGNVSTPPSPAKEPVPPTVLELELSHPPKVGETANITLTFTNRWPGQTGEITGWLTFYRSRSHRRVEIPSEEVLIPDGEMWQGMLPPLGESVQFSSLLRFPDEGEWEIRGYIKSEMGTNSNKSDSVHIQVGSDRAAFSGSPDWKKDYSPSIVSPIGPSLATTLNLSQLPEYQEPVRMNWSVTSKNDYEKIGI